MNNMETEGMENAQLKLINELNPFENQDDLCRVMKLLTGKRLGVLRMICLKEMLLSGEKRSFSLPREEKTFLIAAFTVLYAIYTPGVDIGIMSNKFRKSRGAFRLIKSFKDNVVGTIFEPYFIECPECCNDSCSIGIGSSRIRALPMRSDSLRGLRLQCLVLDDDGFFSKKEFNEIIMPFLAVRGDEKMGFVKPKVIALT